MDWDKTRKYIIYMLVLVNLMILVSILRHNNNASIDNPYFSRKNLEDFERLLAMKEIQLDLNLPKEIYTLGSINGEYRDFNKENHPLLFQDYDIRTLENSKVMTIRLEGSSQEIEGQTYQIIRKKDREDFAEAFMAKYFPENSYKRIFSSQSDEDKLEYKIQQEDFVFEESNFSFSFDSSKVIITATDLIPREASASQKKTISSVEAILSALPQLQAGDKISAIELVYHFDLPKEDLYRIKNVRIFPYWKITSERDPIYILAF